MALNASPGAFKPIELSDNPRAWKGDIGLMNSSKTSVVFTIDSLVSFLKTVHVEVDSNLNELKHLPRYASFGKMEPLGLSDVVAAPSVSAPSEESAPVQAQEIIQAQVQDPTVKDDSQVATSNSVTTASRAEERPAPVTNPAPAGDVFIPTRKVRETPGGGTLNIGNLFGGDDEPSTSTRRVSGGQNTLHGQTPFAGEGFIPTRKVRQTPGGGTLTIGNLFGGDEEPVPRRTSNGPSRSVLPGDSPSANTGFVPTRKVREPPGGVSQIGAIFG